MCIFVLIFMYIEPLRVYSLFCKTGIQDCIPDPNLILTSMHAKLLSIHQRDFSNLDNALTYIRPGTAFRDVV